MKRSRREFLGDTAKMSTFALLMPKLVSGERSLGAGMASAQIVDNKFPSEQEIWRSQTFLADLGPHYTGTAAHRKFEQYLADELGKLGLAPEHLGYTLPTWNPKRWGLKVQSGVAPVEEVPVIAYGAYCGKTPPSGVTGDLVYLGYANPANLSSQLKGKIALVSVGPTPPWQISDQYDRVWGVFNASGSAVLPSALNLNQRVTGGFLQFIEKLSETGAAGVVLSWSSVSDGNAAFNNEPSGGKYIDLPALWVGRSTFLDLRRKARAGAKMTLTLEVDIVPDSPTETLISTLPGMSSDEVIVVHTHTDGPNAVEENGPIAMLALAKYFSQIPKASRNRTIVFVFATGHFAEYYTPSAAWLKQRPEIVRRAVGGITIEHLGSREWADDPTFTSFRPTGEYDWGFAFCPFKQSADIFLSALEGSGAGRVAVLDPNQQGGKAAAWHGIATPLAQAGIPMIAYIARVQDQFAAPPNGCIDKIDSRLLYAQIRMFAKAIHLMDNTPVSVLKEGGVYQCSPCNATDFTG